MAVESDVYVRFGQSTNKSPAGLPLPIIEGDSTDETHYYWSEIRDSNFGLSASDPKLEGEDDSKEKKANKRLDKVTLKKKVDWASTQLFLKCCEAGKAKIAKSKDDQGKGRIDEVTVEVCRTARSEKFAFLTITYKGVRIVNYSIDMSGPEPSETVELEVEQFDFAYQPTDPYSGAKIGDPLTVRNVEGTAGQGGSASAGGASSAGANTGDSVSAAAAVVGMAAGAAGSATGDSSEGTSPSASGSSAEAAANANFPGLWQGTGFGVLPD